MASCNLHSFTYEMLHDNKGYETAKVVFEFVHCLNNHRRAKDSLLTLTFRATFSEIGKNSLRNFALATSSAGHFAARFQNLNTHCIKICDILSNSGFKKFLIPNIIQEIF